MPLNNLNLSKQFSEAQARREIRNEQDIGNFIAARLQEIMKGSHRNNMRMNATVHNGTWNC